MVLAQVLPPLRRASRRRHPVIQYSTKVPAQWRASTTSMLFDPKHAPVDRGRECGKGCKVGRRVGAALRHFQPSSS